MVCRDSQPPVRGAMGNPSEEGFTIPGRGAVVASRPLSVQSLGLATERDTFLAQGLSSAVTQTLQSARAPSTRALYSYRWETFKTWCIRRNECPRSGPLTSVLEFLQELFEQGKFPSTLKVFLAAISACHERIDGKTVGANPLSVQFDYAQDGFPLCLHGNSM